jgi:hypothetical protein
MDDSHFDYKTKITLKKKPQMDWNSLHNKDP